MKYYKNDNITKLYIKKNLLYYSKFLYKYFDIVKFSITFDMKILGKADARLIVG